jgi:hypothetical protein
MLCLLLSLTFVHVSSAGWVGPYQALYTDEDCPNLGCFSQSSDWPYFIPNGTKPTVSICQKMCDYCDGTNPGHCPNGCNAFNGGDGGCCLRLCSPDKLTKPSGTGGPSYRRLDPPAPPKPSGGNCKGQYPAWGPPSACISNAKGAPHYIYHCPWESSGLVSTKKFGGCDAVIYDCLSTNVTALVNLYATHQTASNPPPEWGIPTMVYAECCVKKQCLNGPACGTPPL